VNGRERSISIATNGSVAEVQRILNRMSDAGAGIESLSLSKPTLDDVFLRLTGHSAEEDRHDGKEAQKKI
jgi:ABC-2 type transport system ATP-binding protein